MSIGFPARFAVAGGGHNRLLVAATAYAEGVSAAAEPL